jgi:hypothetical protein
MIVVKCDPEHHLSKLCKARRKVGFICDLMANLKMASLNSEPPARETGKVLFST